MLYSPGMPVRSIKEKRGKDGSRTEKKECVISQAVRARSDASRAADRPLCDSVLKGPYNALLRLLGSCLPLLKKYTFGKCSFEALFPPAGHTNVTATVNVAFAKKTKYNL